jgi:hypothetical protein
MQRFLIALIALTLSTTAVFAQGLEIDLPMGKRKNTSYSYDIQPFPSNIMVYTLEKEKLYVRPEGLSLVTVFGLCCGAEPGVWSRVNEMAAQYKDQGLNTYMINFENGSELKAQMRDIKKFLESNSRPDNLYIDSMGYSIDNLQVNGFPTYFLVDADGNIIFRTNGKDEEGMAILESEILARL